MKIKCPTCNTMIDLDENSYNEIVAQVKNEEVEREVRIQTDALKAKYEAEKKSALLDANQANQKAIAELKAENEQLKKNNSTEIELAKAKAKAEQDKVIQELQGKLTKIQGEVELAKKDAQLENQALKDKFRRDLEMKDEEVERWKNFRMGDSTKDLGESLEKYCADRFEEMRSVAYPHAYFEKDNQVVEGGKADFLFKDYTEDDIELCSIIFDMKTEKDTTATKHKNEDFLDKLNKDRDNKGYQYAVLVSTLEAESSVYNRGIVDMSHKYPNMFVVRPQFFMAIIGLIRNLSLKSLGEKRALVEYQRDNADLTAFEASLMNFKDDAKANYDKAKNDFEKAIEDIDKSIKALEATKEQLLKSTNQMRIGNDKIQEITIKKLTKGNDGMREQFEEAGIDINKKSN
ncbi:MAG: DUF2130 domain-containing protein [Clostridia bacterium]|nr:DUF2130 domain-containing protein [Clostridia bacterium]